MESYKKYRLEEGSKEKEFHDKFLDIHSDSDNIVNMIVFGQKDNSCSPNDTLTEREKNIVLSTIQWLGSPIGRVFLEQCGFTKK